MRGRRTSLGRLVIPAAGVCLAVSAALFAAIFVPPLLWTLAFSSLVLVSTAVEPLPAVAPLPVARSAPPARTAPRSPPLA